MSEQGVMKLEEMISKRTIVRYSAPVMLSLIAQNLVGVVDTAFLSRLGVVELGGSAMASLVYYSLFTVGFALAAGAQIMISHRYGSKRYNEIGKILGQGIVQTLLAALLLIAISLPIGNWLFNNLLSSEAVANAATEYWSYRTFGFLFAFVASAFRSFFVAINRTKVLIYNAIVISVVNIILDYGLIFGNLGLPALGVKGAGIASVIAECSSVLFYLIYIQLKVDRNFFGIHWSAILRFDRYLMRKLLQLSYYLMLQAWISQSVWTVFFFMIESLGEQQLGVASIVRSLYMLLYIPIGSVSTTVRASVGQLIGGGYDDEVKRYLQQAVQISLGLTGLLVLFVFLFPELTLRIYSDDPLLIQAAVPSLRVIGFALLASAVGNMYFAAVSATGDTKMVFKIEVINIIFYLSYAAVMVYWVVAPVAVCFTVEVFYYTMIGVMSYIYISRQRWREKNLIEKES